jgi:hypothetical protein
MEQSRRGCGIQVRIPTYPKAALTPSDDRTLSKHTFNGDIVQLTTPPSPIPFLLPSESTVVVCADWYPATVGAGANPGSDVCLIGTSDGT